MRHVMVSIAVSALMLIVLMLLARVAALRERIAELQSARPRLAMSEEREAIRAEEPVERIPDPRVEPVRRERRAAAVPVERPRTVEMALSNEARRCPTGFSNAQNCSSCHTPGAMKDVALWARATPVERGEIPLLSEIPIVAHLFRKAPGGAVDPLDLSDFQRERIAALKAQRDAEEQEVRRRWQQIIESELTPEQRAMIAAGAKDR